LMIAREFPTEKSSERTVLTDAFEALISLGYTAPEARQKIDAVIATKETRTVNLKTPIPVLLLYWTAQPRPDGQIVFRNDVYGRDQATLAALDSDFRLPVVN